jgi:hypothetical protein
MENESRNLILSLNFQLSFNNTNLIKILLLTKFWDVTKLDEFLLFYSIFKCIWLLLILSLAYI